MQSSGYRGLCPSLGVPAIRALAIPALAILATLAPAITWAADAHRGVTAKPGEIVLQRNVPARHAARPAPPGIALIVNPSPQRELQAALGTGELSDGEYAAIGSSIGTSVQPTTQIAGTVDKTIGQGLAALGGTHPSTLPGGNSLGGSALGMVGSTTRGLGDTVQGALSQFPGAAQPATPGR